MHVDNCVSGGTPPKCQPVSRTCLWSYTPHVVAREKNPRPQLWGGPSYGWFSSWMVANVTANCSQIYRWQFRFGTTSNPPCYTTTSGFSVCLDPTLRGQKRWPVGTGGRGVGDVDVGQLTQSISSCARHWRQDAAVSEDLLGLSDSPLHLPLWGHLVVQTAPSPPHPHARSHPGPPQGEMRRVGHGREKQPKSKGIACSRLTRKHMIYLFFCFFFP